MHFLYHELAYKKHFNSQPPRTIFTLRLFTQRWVLAGPGPDLIGLPGQAKQSHEPTKVRILPIKPNANS